jgi:hypothetical protein
MKSRLCVSLFLALAALGCQQEPDELIITECVGASFYYLDNQSSSDLLVSFGNPWLNQQMDTLTSVNSARRVLVGQDASFGSMPRPSETFDSFVLYIRSGAKKTIVYKQDPVQNALWTKRKHNENDPDFGCQQVDYTLIVTDAMLK